jgi:hypothetical protein
MSLLKNGGVWITLVTLPLATSILLIVGDARDAVVVQPSNWEGAYGAQYPYTDDYEELAGRGLNLVVNNVTRNQSEWERYYSAAVANNLEIIPVLWGVGQTAWSWNTAADEWELDINKYPDSTGAQFLEFLRDNHTYLHHTFALYSFHEPFNPDSPAQVSATRMQKFWRQIHEEEFPQGELKIYGESISWRHDCANGCVDYDAITLYNFAYCGLDGDYHYRVSTIYPDADGFIPGYGECTTDRYAAIEAGKQHIDDYYDFVQSSPAAPDGSRTRHFALIQTFAKDHPSSTLVNRLPTTWEMIEWGTKIVNTRKHRLAGMQWYVFRFGDLYDFTLGDNRYDAHGCDRWQAVSDVASILLDGCHPSPANYCIYLPVIVRNK